MSSWVQVVVIHSNPSQLCSLNREGLSSINYVLYVRVYISIRIQWSLSRVDTTAAQLAVLYREVSLIQRLTCT